MSIYKGDPIPDAKLFDRDESGAARVILASERFAGERIVLFAVPGAFTRTCSEKHLPSFVQHADAIKARGIDEIVCVAVNDATVLAAWARERDAAGKVRMLSDGLCEFTRAVGLGRVGRKRGRMSPPFLPAPLRTGRDTFASSGSPVSLFPRPWAVPRSWLHGQDVLALHISRPLPSLP